MKIYISDSFSVKMLDRERRCVKFFPSTTEEVRKYSSVAWVSSAVYWQYNAHVFSCLLGVDIPYQRKDLKLKVDDIIFLGEIKGGILPRGVTISQVTPSHVDWWRIQLLQVDDV